MALIPCPDCGRPISDAAPVCIGCGRPMTAAAASAPVLPIEVPLSGQACPKCGGDLVSFRTMHEKGAEHAPPFVAPPDRGIISAQTAGCLRPLLGAIVIALGTWYVANGALAAMAFFAGFFLFLKLASARARPVVDQRYREGMERWQRRHLCLRCGATVVRGDSGGLEVEDVDAELDALVRSGQKIQAITLLRERRGLGLKAAKEAVEERMRGG
jgi:hypothetical protein